MTSGTIPIYSSILLDRDDLTWMTVGLAGVAYCAHGLFGSLSGSSVFVFAILKFFAAAGLVERVLSDTEKGNTPAPYGMHVAAVDSTMGVLFLAALAAAGSSSSSARKAD
jgi:hypothetical protein